ncbi:MAG: hypothetical protein KJ645_07210, partial [Planctomycetes bacterium]|nr:hypothetical protein [Planctomycetota bacterium]
MNQLRTNIAVVPENGKRIVLQWVLYSWVMLAICFAAHRLGSQREFLSVLIAQVSLVVAGAFCAFSMWMLKTGTLWARVARNLLLVATVAGCAALLSAVPAATRPLCFALLAGVMTLPGMLPTFLVRAARTLTSAAVLFSAYLLLIDHSPLMHMILDQWARLLSMAATWVLGRPLDLGPSAAGVDLLVFCLLLHRTGSPIFSNIWRTLRQVAGILCMHAAYVLLIPSLLYLQSSLLDPNHRLGFTAFDVTWVLAVLEGFYIALTPSLEAKPALQPRKRIVAHALPAIPALGIALALLAFDVIPEPIHGSAKESIRIAIHDPETLDRRIPTRNNLRGQRASGMFGFIEPFLEASGFQVQSLDVECADLSEWDVIVVINLINGFSEEKVHDLRAFVENGGGLLLAGDHTGDEQIRIPSNEILEPWHLALNFDSALALRSSWFDGMRFVHHPVTRNLTNENDVQIWTGASLSVAPPAYPVVIGRCAYSDKGNRDRKDGSKLGNFRHHMDERMGDLALVGAAEPGKGRVLVFGDTS